MYLSLDSSLMILSLVLCYTFFTFKEITEFEKAFATLYRTLCTTGHFQKILFVLSRIIFLFVWVKRWETVKAYKSCNCNIFIGSLGYGHLLYNNSRHSTTMIKEDNYILTSHSIINYFSPGDLTSHKQRQSGDVLVAYASSV